MRVFFWKLIKTNPASPQSNIATVPVVWTGSGEG